MAIGGRPKPEICFLPVRLRWTLFPKERYGHSLSLGSNDQPSNWEVNTLSLSYRRAYGFSCFFAFSCFFNIFSCFVFVFLCLQVTHYFTTPLCMLFCSHSQHFIWPIDSSRITYDFVFCNCKQNNWADIGCCERRINVVLYVSRYLQKGHTKHRQTDEMF